MYPSVQKWLDGLPRWQRWIHRVLSAIGQDEVGYNWFGYYQQNPK